MQIPKYLKYYLLRTSVLPIEEAFNFIDSDDRQKEQFVRNKIADPDIEDSFFLASPDFNKALHAYFKSNKTFSVDDKIVKSFYKYFVRMSSRCTPFGLFAGCSFGEFSHETNVKFGLDKHKSISRLDMYYVSALSEYLNKVPSIKEQLVFFPNETIYSIGSNYRYIEFVSTNSTRRYKISGFTGNSLIKELLQFSKNGVAISDLKSLLIGKKFQLDEVEAYIQQLIDNQILVSDLLPSVTGEEYFTVLIKRLKKLDGTEHIIFDLELVDKVVKSGHWTEEKKIMVKDILSKYVLTETKNIVQTDLFFNTETNTINNNVISEINKLITDYINIQEIETPLTLDHFVKKFSSKYGDQEVPLLLALDNENGIGYNVSDSSNTAYMPLLENISLSKSRYSSSVKWNGSKGQKLKILLDALQKGLHNVDLKLLDFKKATEKNSKSDIKLPESMFIFGSLIAKSTEELDTGNFSFLLSALGGPSGTNLLARFCHGDENLQSEVKESLLKEENTHEDCIYAEVVHLPDGRTGNVIMRPTLRDYEIPILTNSSVDENHTIKLSDLLVSIDGEEIILRSKRLNKRIIPRLTNAHNYTNGLPVYKFLCDLQHQGYNKFPLWDWSILSDQPFLPRIQFGKIILERATWNLSKEEFLKNTERETVLEYFTKFKEKHRIPDKVVIVEGDNELLLSLNSQLSANILGDKLKKRNVKIKEYLFSPSNCWVKDNNGSYANELIIPFFNEHFTSSSKSRQQLLISQNGNTIKRNFKVGDDWLYFKIYTGNKTADKILVEIIKPLVEELLIEGWIEKWFFIRYYEHGHHIRLRFFNSRKEGFWAEVVKRMNKAFEFYQKTGLVDKIQIDTYEREIERYGNSTMEFSEQLFFYDSIAITELLELIEGDQGEEYRWLLALLNIDFLLDDFKLTLHEKFHLLSQLREYFYEETNKGSKNKNLWVSLNDKYRKYSKMIFDILDHNFCSSEDVSEAVNCFKRRSERNKIIVDQVLDKFKGNPEKNEISLLSFLSSHIHMTLNRTFIAKQRIHETVIYHLLAKYYDSKISRLEKSNLQLQELIIKMEKS